MDAFRSLFRPLNGPRAIVLALFIGLLVLFRHVLVLLVFMVAFARPLRLASHWLASHTRLRRSVALLLLLASAAGLLTVAVDLGMVRAFEAFLAAREALPERIAAFRQTPLFLEVQEYLGGADLIVDAAKRYAAGILGYLAVVGHLVLHAFIGFILAVVYVLEQEEIDGFRDRLDPRSLGGTLLRWLGYLADAISVTLQFQMVVAACNAVLTLPVLLLVGIPHAAPLLFMIFLSGMVPVVGNFVAGAVLTLLAYQASGWPGVATFVGLTFLLHKVESYYLNPRLASRHVRLPGFVLIISLILWEDLLGFVGLFVSFPFLYVASRIGAEFREEEGGAVARAPQAASAG
ncbi:MAG TPA: AI-2E family transporter [Vicinamibacteria bacterium]|jgi:predicted PurR-regulated permease PerM|nr:AI-2E family transporter [Vicinamibacteria bacterium]